MMRSIHFNGKAAVAASQNIKERDYWLKKLSGIEGKTGFFPTGKKRGNKPAAGKVTFKFSGELFQRLMKLSNESDPRLHMVLAAGLVLLLYKYTGKNDIIIGSPIYKQDFQGEFINTVLALRIQLQEQTCKELLLQVKQTIAEAVENQNYPIDVLINKLNMTFDHNDFPLFDVVILLENIHDKRYIRHIHPNMVFSFSRKKEYIEGVVEYNRVLYDEIFIERLTGHFKHLIGQVLFDIDASTAGINILPEDETRQLLFDFNGPNREYPGPKTICELFEQQVRKTPDHIALAAQKSHLSYKELNESTEQLAHLLIQKGVQPDTIVGVMVERSIRMVVGILGVLKAGGAYLPIDPDYPEERINYMLEDSAAEILVTTQDYSKEIKFDKEILYISDAINRVPTTHRFSFYPSNPLNLTYLIYTSGSTGKAKGVMLGHRNLVNLLEYQFNYTSIDFSRVLQFTTICFDVSFQEIFSTLLSGGELFLVDQNTRGNIPLLFRVINERHIKTLFLPASFLKFIFNESDYEGLFPRSVTHIVSAGEQLIVNQRFRKYLQDNNIYLHNHYGPSETHVVTALTLDPAADIPQLPSIGKPVLNTDIYIQDKNNNLQPVNVPGELYIGGFQVGRGYLNNPELTAEKFQIPDKPGYHRSYRSYRSYFLYQTGDLARWLQDGSIEFLGRIDHQVKIRGFRVEPGEIESLLLNHHDIKESIVMVKEEQNKEKYLCAYIVTGNKQEVSGLREYLSGRLPGYMVPSHFVRLEQLPLTPNGKIDRKALPEPQPANDADRYCAPRNEIDRKLVKIWSDILELEEETIGIDSDFFQVGGHSLKATRMIAKVHQLFHVTIPLTKVFIIPTIRGLAEYIKGCQKEILISIEPVETKEYYNLSSAQKRLYILQRMNPDSTGYNMPLIMELKGDGDHGRWEMVFRQLIKRHESLRTSFKLVDQEPVQIIHKEVELELEAHQLNQLHERTVIINNFIRPFDLSRPPLLRVGLLKEQKDRYFLMLDMHHIISDGASMEILINDFAAFYKGEILPELKIQYKDYARWQNRQKQTQTIKEQEQYWLKEYTNQEQIPVLNLPADFARPAVQNFEGSGLKFEITKEEAKKLKNFYLTEGSTLYMALMTLFNVFLAKLSGQEEIIVGFPVAGRRYTDLQQIMGIFVNTLAMRSYPAGEKTIKDFLHEVTSKTLNARENQDYPFEDLVDQVAVKRDLSRNPLFDVMLTMQDIDTTKLDMRGLTMSPSKDESIIRTSKFDLTLTVLEAEEGLQLHFTYCTKLFKHETIERFAGYFKRVLSTAVRQPVIRLIDIEILSRQEKRQLLVDFNNTAAEYQNHRCLHELFTHQVERTPCNTAVVGPGSGIGMRFVASRPGKTNMHLTYCQLNEKSTQLARLLIEKGVKPGTIVGIMVERSVDMIIGILGILKAGGAYLPVDPESPEERINYMLADSDAKFLVTSPVLSEKFKEMLIVNCQLLIVNEIPPKRRRLNNTPKEANSVNNYQLTINNSQLNFSNLAYIIYTSGTTGKPKGVIIGHQNVVNIVTWFAGRYELHEQTPVVLLSNYTFDASVNQIFGPLLHGAVLYIPHQALFSNQEDLRRYIEINRIYLIHFVPALLKELLYRGEKIAGIKHVLSGGDKLDETVKDEIIKKGYVLHNQYGPTETTIDALAARCTPGKVVLGKPVSNTRCYMLDKNNRLVPIGVTGEICVAGHGVSRGYLNNPELTAEKFQIQNGYHRSYRSYRSYILYKTGDLGRWLPDGNIEFLGRTDQQVKIRGYRIEPGEIESQLLKHKEIEEVIVTAKEDEKREKYLCAYIVSNDEIPVNALREYLRKDLPGYMIPSYFVRLERLPLTPIGKIDHGALPEPDIAMSVPGYIPPADEVEEKLAAIWSEVLDIEKEKISIDNDFFQLGGHSLKATRMIATLHQVFHVSVSLAEVFKTPFIRELAQLIKKAGKIRYSGIQPGEKKEYYPLSSAQQRLYILQQMELKGIAYNMPQALPLPGEFDTERLDNIFRKLIHRHESLRTSFEMIDKEPVQRIHHDLEFQMEYYESSVIRHLSSEFVRPFDLSCAPLLRAGLIDTGEERFLLLDMHHIITDGTSQGVLAKEFSELYLNADGNLPVLRLQYKDYAQWQNSPAQQEPMKQQESYWTRLFSSPGQLPVLTLPTDYPRPVVQSFAGSCIDFVLNEQETRQLKDIARKTDTTLYMTILSLYTILLWKLSGQEDIIVGTPVASRRHADLQRIIGMFVNTLAVRNYSYGEKTFSAFLSEVKKQTIEAFENQEYPFEDLVDKLSVRRDTSRNPIFDVMFNLLNQADYRDPIPGKNHQNSYSVQNQMKKRTSKFDLNLTAIEMEDGKNLFFELEYSTKLFKAATIEKIIGYFKHILSILSTDADIYRTIKLSDIEIAAEEEKEKILEMSRGIRQPYEPGQTIHGWFEEQAAKTPDAIAVVGIGPGLSHPEQKVKIRVPVGIRHHALTYRQLNQKSNQLARLLRKKGAGIDRVVGLMVDPAVETIIGMLAILKAGAAYLPIDTKVPENRKKIIIDESTMHLLLVNQPLESLTYLEEKSIEIMDLTDSQLYSQDSAPLENINKESDLAYVIYTSGSTGIPKGVMLEHCSLVNLIKFHHKYTAIDCTRVTQFASIGFDASFHEIFSTLLAGGTLYVPGKEVKTDIPEFCRLIRENEIKTTFLPIAFLKMIFSEESYAAQFPACIRHIQTAGEQVVIIDKFRQYLKENNVYLHNHYGPSETHVVTALTIEPRGEIPARPSIGKPICSTTIYILDRAMHLQPAGIVGELYAGGIAVGRGYQNNPEQTAEKFQTFNISGYHRSYRSHTSYITHKSYTLYRTGDLGKWLPDGNIEFIGRIDFQLKIRGFRIELGEIENQLLKHDNIKETVVIPHEDKNGDKYLCAYMVIDTAAPGKEPDNAGLREFLSQTVPDYMVPSYFVPVDKIPLTTSGKIDRKALPQPEIKTGEDYVEPRNNIEKKLLQIWQEVLGLDRRHPPIGIDDNFFLLGGHSLKATVLVSKIHKEFNVRVPLAEVFKVPSIRGISRIIAGLAEDRYIPVKPVEKKDYYSLSSTQRRLYFLQQIDLTSIGYNLPVMTHLEGELNAEAFNDVIKKLINRHHSLRTSFIVVKGTPVQHIHNEIEFKIEYFGAERKAQTAESEGESCANIIKDFIRPFDLSQAPLIRVGLVKIENRSHLFMVDMHHIISDGFSHDILVRDFMGLYKGDRLQQLPLQYKDFSEWQNNYIESGSLKEQEEYWQSRFEGEFPVTELPTDFDRPAAHGFAGHVINFEIHKKETKELKKMALAEDATLYIVLLTIFNVFLSKLCNREDIIIGTPVAGRGNPELEQVMGMFVNTLVMRNYPESSKSFTRFLKEVRKHTFEAFENQDYPFEQFITNVNMDVKRDVNRNPLFDVMFALQNMEIAELDIPGLKLRPYEYEIDKAPFDLSLAGVEEQDRLIFSLAYSTTLFKKETIERFISYFKKIISSIIENPGIGLWRIEIIDEEEKRQLLVDFNDTQRQYPKDKTIHNLFEDQAKRTPDSTAVFGPSAGAIHESPLHISYNQLNTKANQLACLLREKGVKPDKLVAIMMEPGIRMITTLLGILKAGAAYLPIDPGTPPQRMLSMLNDSNAPLLVTDGKLPANHSFTAIQGQTVTRTEPRVTAPRERIINMDALPMIDRSLVDYNKYNRYIGFSGVKHTISLEATRGCPYNCAYCFKIFPSKQVTRSAENIFAELKYYYDLGIRRFLIIDDIFNLNIKNSSRFFEMIIKNGLNRDIHIFFTSGLRGDILTTDYIDLMVEAGTICVSPALETSSPRLQKLIGKNLKIEKLHQNVRYFCEKYPHVITELFMMHGFPTETEEEARQTIEFLKNFKWIHFPYLNILRIYSNTRMAKFAVEKGIPYKSIIRSEALAFHELPETLPFTKSFTLKCQTELLNEYFLSKERLLDVLPYQMQVMGEDELVQKYDTYLPVEIRDFSGLLEFIGISREELGKARFLSEDRVSVPDLDDKLKKDSPIQMSIPAPNALRVLLLDLDLYFSDETKMLYDLVDEPLGLVRLMTHLKQTFDHRVNGKIARSRMDFNSYKELKVLLEEFKPDLIGIRTLTFYRDFFHKTVSLIRQWGIRVPIIVGGPHATIKYKALLQDLDIDLAVLGEGEITLVELVEKILANHGKLPGEKVLAKIPGLAFIPGKEKNNQTFAREIIMWDAVDAPNGMLANKPGKNPANINQSRDLAYIIYTSGTTGRPKGVMIKHQNVLSTLHWFNRAYNIQKGLHVLQAANIVFDVSVEEIFASLIFGGKLFIPEKETLLDKMQLLAYIEKYNINIAQFVPMMLKNILGDGKKISCLQVVIGGGDKLEEFIKNLIVEKGYNLYNHYGPTEVTVDALVSCCDESRVVIGKPIANVRAYIFDRNYRLLPIGIPGELCIAGDGIARGYLNNPEFTAEKFQIPHKSRYHRSYRSNRSYVLYKTGDLARWLPDGNIEFLGRIDKQVKIRGYRIEPEEIENCLLNHKDIKEAVVIAKEEVNKENFLCAYIAAAKTFTVPELRNHLARQLPDYMIPADFRQLAKIPLTPAGKVDRNALLASGEFMDTGVEYVSPGSQMEKKLLTIWLEVLGRDKTGKPVSIHDNFFDMGGSSFSLIRLNNRIKKDLKIEIPLVTLFNYPTTASLAAYLNREEISHAGPDADADKKESRGPQLESLEIAVIGMAGRFPGAKNIHEFWDNLKNGVESIAFLNEDRLNQLEVDADTKNHPDYISAKGRLEDVEYFDSFFFGYTPAEAEIMDPQVRIFHQCTWEALEHAGYDPETCDGTIGLYAGAGNNPYWDILPLKLSAEGSSKESGVEQWNAVQFCDKDFLSTRVGYKLNLRGPCVVVQSACSTSLLAVDLACQALLSGKCDMALAGGVSVTFPDEAGYIYQEGTIISPDGHCRTFDARANGTIAGNGAGVAVLKPLQKAILDRDTIYAVIKGSAINNDGKERVGFTAPSIQGQVKAIENALHLAGVQPETIGYVETHGTATSLGDPVEIESLKQAFKIKDKRNYCAIGAVKTNIGHLDAAAGIAGFIKTVLALNHRLIPPSLHFEKWNLALDSPDNPFYVNTMLLPWKNDKYPLRAGVSSFGLGGTNVHVILEEAPVETRDKEGTRGLAPLINAETSTDYHLIFLSAKTPTTLDKMTRNLAEYFEKNLLNHGNPANPINPGQNPALTLADAAYTLHIGRKAFRHRKMLVASTNNIEKTIHALEAGEGEISLAKEEKPTVIFMFSGQGSQYVNMGLDLYETEPVFRDQVDRCFEILKNITGIDMKPVLYPDKENIQEAKEKIGQFLYTTPIKFIFEYSLAVLLMTWGIQPAAMIGHSFGEYAAACLSGVFSLDDALFMAALRGRLMHGLPPGAMLSVPLDEKELEPWLNDKISLAAVNGPSLCVVSGPVPDIDNLENQLNEKGHECLRYYVPKAGHSRMVEPIMEEFKENISRVTFNKPRIPYISGLTGKWITHRQVMEPGYWARHLRGTVRFADGLTTLFKQPGPLFLQVGPGRGLTLFVNQHPDKETGTLTLNMVRHHKEEVSDVYYTLTQVGQLWLKGIPIDGQAFYRGQQPCRVSLPTYPFEKTFYPLSRDFFRLGGDWGKAKPGKTRLHKNKDIADWFYVPLWERRPLPPEAVDMEKTQTYLLFMDENRAADIGAGLKEQLEQNGHQVIVVIKGNSFEKKNETLFCINPGDAHDYKALMQQIHRQSGDRFPRGILHLWGMDEENSTSEIKGMEPGGGYAEKQVDKHLSMGFYSLIYLAKALGDLDITGGIQIDVITCGIHEITGEEKLSPAKAAVLGPVKVVPQEYPQVRCRNIDVVLPKTQRLKETLPGHLLSEISTPPTDVIVAYRNDYRWVQSMTPLRLPKPAAKQLPVKQQGTYLVTGGLGGIGMILAEHLAKSGKAKLILTGRSPFPARCNWNQWLRSHPDNDSTSRKIQKLKQMEELGAEVLVLQADVSNREQMEQALQQAEEKFGTLNGVIHCAGNVGSDIYNSIREITDLQCRDQFQPKVYGLLVLEKVLENRQLDFCLLMSSTSAILGGLGFAAYSAANIFMDAFVHFYKRVQTSPTRWISVDWDGWLMDREETGEPGDRDKTGVIGNAITELAMTAEEGAEAFERVLAWPGALQVIHSAGDLYTRINQWIELETLADREDREEESTTSHKTRPPLSTPYEAPATPEENALVNIWGDILGYRQIGTRDNFFELGGDSLKAVIVTSKVHKALNAKIPLKEFFNQPFIEALARYITKSGKSSYFSIEPVEKKQYYPLSSAQKRMFIANQLERENQSTAYNINSVQVLEGELDRQKLARIFRELVSRHESFRTAFVLIEGEPFQRVYDKVDFEIEEERSSRFEGTRGLAPLPTGPADRRPQLVTTLISSFIHPFDLSRAPLLRVGLLELPHTPAALGDHPPKEGREQKHILMVDMHHIISDGTSIGILVKEFITLYQGESLPPLRIRYKDYQAWQAGEKSREALQAQEKYWLKEFETGCPVLNLPLDFQRPANRDFQGSHIAFRVEPIQLDRLKALAAGEEATLFMVLLSIYTILISRISTSEDIVVGTGVAGRRHSDLEHIIGMFINMLPIRNYPGGEKPFIKFLREVKKQTLEAFENQDYPYEELVSKVDTGKRQANRNAVFDVVFELQTMEIPFVRIPGLEIKSYPLESRLSRFDMSWVGEEVDGELIFDVEYRTKLFKKETIQGFIGFFKEILAAVLEDREILLKDIRISHGLLSPKSQKPEIRLRF